MPQPSSSWLPRSATPADPHEPRRKLRGIPIQGRSLITKQKKTEIIVAAILFILALGLTLYPLISNYVNQKYASEIHTAYFEVIEQADDSALQESWDCAVAYNNSITPGTTDADAYSQEALTAASQNYDTQLNIAGNGMMGYVEIPKIDVNLPIYHGTGSDSLDRGVGHLLGSSLPVGGSSTHSILTGHSGMASKKMFTDLEQLALGDVFYLRILNETLAYQVREINTVLPYDTSLLGICSGEDLCTLVTCTPYGVNTHRLLVCGSRIPYEEAEMILEETSQEEQPQSSWMKKYIEGIIWGIVVAIGLILLIISAVQIYRRFTNNYGGGTYAEK